MTEKLKYYQKTQKLIETLINKFGFKYNIEEKLILNNNLTYSQDFHNFLKEIMKEFDLKENVANATFYGETCEEGIFIDKLFNSLSYEELLNEYDLKEDFKINCSIYSIYFLSNFKIFNTKEGLINFLKDEGVESLSTLFSNSTSLFYVYENNTFYNLFEEKDELSKLIILLHKYSKEYCSKLEDLKNTYVQYCENEIKDYKNLTN